MGTWKGEEGKLELAVSGGVEGTTLPRVAASKAWSLPPPHEHPAVCSQKAPGPLHTLCLH